MNSHRKITQNSFTLFPTKRCCSRHGKNRLRFFCSIASWGDKQQSKLGGVQIVVTTKCFLLFERSLLAGGYEKFANVIRFYEHPTTGQRPTPPAWLSRTEIDATKAPRILSSTPWKWYLRAFCRLLFLGVGYGWVIQAKPIWRSKNGDESHGTMCKISPSTHIQDSR